ncbi:hypothetical protein [Thermococcus stetteri]|uniref:hypothetical protein n=1 Tax=Thermococcus stetteri TaxID=49900 RepID=UPI001AE8216A|nr:hypothetical protein [Thermococcus stetteri]MBP1910889.1 hypothetical protein [Thermococcus stetteri]
MKARAAVYPLLPTWEFLLWRALPPRYYVRAACLQLHPYPVRTFHFEPSLFFATLVVLPSAVLLGLGLWKGQDILTGFGFVALITLSTTLALLILFEKSWIPVAGGGIMATIGSSLIKTGKGEKYLMGASLFISVFILCSIVWSGVSLAI